MKMIKCNMRLEKLEAVREKLFVLGVPGLTVSEVMGIGKPMHQMKPEEGSTSANIPQFHQRVEVSIILEDDGVDEVVDMLVSTVRTGNLGDGKIFVFPVDDVIRIRTGERGDKALY